MEQFNDNLEFLLFKYITLSIISKNLCFELLVNEDNTHVMHIYQ